jgi:hypothetical protein
MSGDQQYWISLLINVIVVPLLGYIFYLFSQQSARVEKLEAKIILGTEAFLAYKEVSAYKFATLELMRDVEDRIVKRFDRIEDKLDAIQERNKRRDIDS